MIAKVMGRNVGWLALESGIAGGGDAILIPELPYELDEIVRVSRQRSRFGKRFSIVVVAEGAKPKGGQQVVEKCGGASFPQASAESPDTQWS